MLTQDGAKAVDRDAAAMAVRVMGVVSDFSERKRQEIETAHDGNQIFVNVRDEGPGINAALQQEVFQPFITTKSHSLGMGLTISRALIKANGGKLWHTQADDTGAAFHFTLPTILS